MEVKIGKYIICKNAKTTLEIYKITGVGFDYGIISAEPMIEIELIREVPIKRKEVTLTGKVPGWDKAGNDVWYAVSDNTAFRWNWGTTNGGKYSAKELTDNFRELTHAEQVLYGI